MTMYTDTSSNPPTETTAQDKALESLAAGLENARMRWSDFLRASAKFHRYSFRNQLMIFAQCPQASNVAGYNVWKSLKRFVKKGEKGISILAPRVGKNAETEETELRGFHASYVFDISQTDGEALPEQPPVVYSDGDCPMAAAQYAQLENHLKARGIKVTTRDFDNPKIGGWYIPQQALIEINQKNQDVHRLGTLIHETAHVILHTLRISGGSLPEEVKELEAESVTAIVAAHIKLERQSSFDYLASWNADTATLAKFADRITSASRQIIALLEPPEA
jgi:hypothetical protein